MNSQISEYRYILDKSPKKHPCPNCGKRTFVRFVDQKTGELLPDGLGRCDREANCGYFLDPYKSGYAKENGMPTDAVPMPRPKPKPTTYLSPDWVSRSMRGYDQNHFAQYLKSLFGSGLAGQLIQRYQVGTSARWKGATAFWQVDAQGRPRQCKVMLYDAQTGRRVKDSEGRGMIFFAGRSLAEKQGVTDPELQQCLFGEHLLNESPHSTVCIVESEKTAIICAGILHGQDVLFLARGGKQGVKAENQKALMGRRVVLYPDQGCFQDWGNYAARLRAMGIDAECSDVLDQSGAKEGSDLADYLAPDNQGYILRDGYPMFWDVDF